MDNSIKCFELGTNIKGISNSKVPVENDKSTNIITFAVMRSRPWQIL